MVYVSVRGRIWLEAEAANMVESVGNYTKHRKVPVVVEEDGKYVTYLVPSISGESIAHAYQTLLSKRSRDAGEKVCKYCSQSIFLKSTNYDIFCDSFSEVLKDECKASKDSKSEKDLEEDKIEETIIRNCAVEDIGGFLYASNKNVKRTSSFMAGYMIPVREALSASSADPQLHSRYALGTKFMQEGQMIYYVELGSAVYTFSFDLTTENIGKITFSTERYLEKVLDDQSILRRSCASLEALRDLLIEFPVGAKRSRFMPNSGWESIVIAVSDDVWTVPSPFVSSYLEEALKKAERYSAKTKLYYYPQADKKSAEVIGEAIQDAMSRLGCQSKS